MTAKMSTDDYKLVAKLYKDTRWDLLQGWFQQNCIFEASWEGYVQPKERPRSSGNGHTYTPKKTRNFETAVRAWFTDTTNMRPVFCPVALRLSIFDKSPMKGDKLDFWMQEWGFVTSQVGDLDNKEKAVTDALNGYLYSDDKQITQVSKMRCYGGGDGFMISCYRSGFSKHEIEQLRKFL